MLTPAPAGEPALLASSHVEPGTLPRREEKEEKVRDSAPPSVAATRAGANCANAEPLAEPKGKKAKTLNPTQHDWRFIGTAWRNTVAPCLRSSLKRGRKGRQAGIIRPVRPCDVFSPSAKKAQRGRRLSSPSLRCLLVCGGKGREKGAHDVAK